MAKKQTKKETVKKKIKQISYDANNMKGILEDFPKHCDEATKLGITLSYQEYFGNVAICGMGGSAISGDLIRNILFDCRIPIYTIRDYHLPDYINQKSLVFVTSYSGNTEETLSIFEEALSRNCKIVAISSGGKLEELAKKARVPHIKIPSGIQPRMATAYLFFPIFNVLRKSNIANISDEEVYSTLQFIKQMDFKTNAQKIAKKLNGKIPLIYTSPRFSSIATKWKTDINENTKVHAFCNIYPEFNHNEINAYEGKQKGFGVLILHDNAENPKIMKRISVTEKLMKSKGFAVDIIAIKGNSMLAKVLSAQYLGLWVSYYLAMMRKINPTPVKIIEDLKRELVK